MSFLIDAADAVILFSVPKERSSIGLEALVCGILVITTREGSLCDLVVHKKGYLCQARRSLARRWKP